MATELDEAPPHLGHANLMSLPGNGSQMAMMLTMQLQANRVVGWYE